MIAKLKAQLWNWWWNDFWGQNPPQPKPSKLEIVRVESQKITLAQWRSQTTAVGSSIELAQNQIYRAQRDILESQHPRHVMLKMGCSETDRLVHQARIEGYQMVLIIMDSFAQPLKQKREIEATFEAPEQEK